MPVLPVEAAIRQPHDGSRYPEVAWRIVNLGEPGGILPPVQQLESGPDAAGSWSGAGEAATTDHDPCQTPAVDRRREDLEPIFVLLKRWACHLTGQGTGFLNLRSRFDPVQALQSGRVVQGTGPRSSKPGMAVRVCPRLPPNSRIPAPVRGLLPGCTIELPFFG